MFSTKRKTRILTITLATAMLAGAGVGTGAAIAGVVVKSSGPSASQFPVGKKVADSATITLRAGDNVTVLTSEGTRVMKGAGTFRVGEKPTATRGRFAALSRKKAARRVRTGAVRGTGSTAPAAAKAVSPNLWYVDVSRSGTMCLFDAGTVRLWRPSNEGIATYRVVDTASESSVDVTFDDGESVAALDPARMMVSEGATYTLAGPEGTDVASVSFVTLEGDYPRADQLAEALIANGCMTQVGLMADRLGG